MNLSKALKSAESDINEVQEWADNEYNKYFSQYFQGEVDLYKKLRNPESVITDSDLEWILTTLPLELFSVSEQLSKLKTSQEVIKLHIKETEREFISNSDPSVSMTQRKEEAALLTAEDRLLVSVYSTIIERVERQVSFSRELVMSGKKIWDSRRSTEGLGSSAENVCNDLPEYEVPAKKQTYVK